MVDLDSQSVRDWLWNLLTGFLTMTWLIWTLSLCVIYSQIYWPDFWLWHGWFGLSDGVWFALKSTDQISDSDMVDLDSQAVRDWLSNLLTWFLTVTWLIWTLRKCVICSQISWLDFWLWHGWFGLSGSVWLALKFTDQISDCDMVDLDSQEVCDLLSNQLTGFLTVTWLIWTLRKCVIGSQIYWPDFWLWHGWFGLSGGAWFALKSTNWISDHDMIDLDSQQVRDWLLNLLTRSLTVTWLIWTLSLYVIGSQIHWLDFWLWHGWFGLLGSVWFALKCTAQISDCDMVDLDSQFVRDLLSNPLTRFLTVTWLIWTLSLCVIGSEIYWLDFWPWHDWFGFSVGVWLALKSTDWISDHDMIDLDSQQVCDLLSNLLAWFVTMTWLIWTLSLCVIYSQIYWPDVWLWHDWFGLSDSVWFALKSTDQISDSDMVDLDSQAVRDWLSNLLTGFLNMTWLIWTLRKCVICS